MPRTLNAILFDLDNTLYDARAGLQEAGDERITCWIMERLGLSHDEATELRLRTWREHGTTARGLEVEFGLPPAPLYEFAISALEPADYLAAWPELDAVLRRLRADCHVFTNATRIYAEKVLRALGVAEHFGCIFDIEHNGWVCKPDRGIYERIVGELGLPAARIAFIEDNPANLVPAAELGMFTVLVGGEDGDLEPDLRIAGILDLADALQEVGVRA